MPKCDKCGCEHNSKSTCPRCGAPVIAVSEDYLRRKKLWEEQHKDGKEDKRSSDEILAQMIRDSMRKPVGKTNESKTPEPEEELLEDEYVVYDSISSALKANDDSDEDEEKERKTPAFFTKLSEFLSRLSSDVKDGHEDAIKSDYSEDDYDIPDTKQGDRKVDSRDNKKLFHKKNESGFHLFDKKDKKRQENELEDFDIDESSEEVDYEKLLLEHSIRKSKAKKYILGTSSIAVICALLIYVAINIITMDRSDLRYYTGNELGSVRKGDITGFEKTDFGSSGKVAVLAYSEGLDSFLLGDEENNLYGWRDGKSFRLEDIAGKMSGQYMFSDNGKYLCFITCEESFTDSVTDVSGDYYLTIVDMANGRQSVYDRQQMMNLLKVTDDGRVVFTAIDTMEYSIVIGAETYVADMSECTVVGEVEQVMYCDEKDAVVYTFDGSLYMCSLRKNKNAVENGIIPENEHIFIDDEVSCIVEEQKGTVFYLKEDMLYSYDGTEQKLAARNMDTISQLFISNTGNIGFIKNNGFYFVEDGQPVLKLSDVREYIWCQENGILVCLDKEGINYEIQWTENRTNLKIVDKDVVKLCSISFSQKKLEGYLGFKQNTLTRTVLKGSRRDSAEYSLEDAKGCGGDESYQVYDATYFVDKDGILWKLSKDRGIVQIAENVKTTSHVY